MPRWRRSTPPPSDPAPVLSIKESAEFWQREAQFYERRAGEQGVMLNRIATLSVGLVAATPVIWTFAPRASPELLATVAAGLSAILLFLLSNAVRLMNEMMRLREYVHHAEAQLELLRDEAAPIAAYRSWREAGAKPSRTVTYNNVVVIAMLVIVVVGAVLGTFVVLGTSGNPYLPLLGAVVGVAALLVVLGAALMLRDGAGLRALLVAGPEAAPDRADPPQPGT